MQTITQANAELASLAKARMWLMVAEDGLGHALAFLAGVELAEARKVAADLRAIRERVERRQSGGR